MSGKRLPSLINAYSATAVRQMAEGRGLRLPPGARKAGTVDRLVEVGPEPASVAQAIGLLSAQQRALLELLLLYPGEVSAEYIIRAGSVAGVLQRAKNEARTGYYSEYYYRTQPGNPAATASKALPDLLAGLSARLLALTTSSGGYGGTMDLSLSSAVCVPGEIRPLVVQVVAPTLPTLDAPPATPVAPDPRAVHRALFLIWSALRSKPAGLTQAGLVRKLDARRLGQALGVVGKDSAFDAESDLPYLFFLRRAAQRLGLLVARDGSLEAAGRERLREFLAQPWPQRSLRLLRAWIEDSAFELNLTSTRLQWQTGQAVPLLNGVAAYRRYLGQVAALPDRWIGTEAFVRWMRLHYFGFLALPDEDSLAEYDFGTALYRLPYGGVPGDDPWESREGRAIRDSLTGALHWLGVVELSGAAGTDQAFRLTAAGRIVLAAFADPPHEAAILAPLTMQAGGGRVVVQPNFQILALGDVPDETLFALSELAELVRVEQAVEFKLTRESVYAAQQAGWTPVAILDLLRGATGGALAQNVERSILDWAAQHERIVIRRNATLLATRDAALLDRLTADPQIAPLLGERLLPTLALLRPHDLGSDRALGQVDLHLVAAGELPARSNLISDAPVPSFQFDDAGRVTWRGPLPDLRLLGLLATVTRPDPDGAPLLDGRATRSAALSRRWKPDDVTALLAALAAWHVGPLPPAVTRQIKIWAGFQGRVTLRTVTLLEVERPELLADLLADPLLAPLLEPLPAAGTAARVALAPTGPPPPPTPPLKGEGSATAATAATDGRKRRTAAAAPVIPIAPSGTPSSSPRPSGEGLGVGAVPADLDALRATLRRYGFAVDEDA